MSTANCGEQPFWWPLEAASTSMDEDAGQLVLLPDDSFPLASQRVDVASLAIPYDFGLLEIFAADGLSTTAQSWVQPTLTAGGRFSAGFNGAPLMGLCDTLPFPQVTASGELEKAGAPRPAGSTRGRYH